MKKNLSKIVKGLRIGILVMFIMFFLMAGLFVVAYTFANPKVDTTTITNIGFAIVIAMGSTCFSYYRTFDQEQKNAQKLIKISGERFLFVAILFLIASFTKYIGIHVESLLIEPNRVNRIVINAISLFYSVNFIASFWITFFSMYSLAEYLFNTNIKNWLLDE
jgi:hypothetical protein